jgi:5,10-methylenetetrahydromethanopterin reductase
MIHLGLGIWQRYAPDQLIAMVQMCEQLGYDQIWYQRKILSRSLCWFGRRGDANSKIKLGHFIADPYTMHPALTAVAIATIDELSHGAQFS